MEKIDVFCSKCGSFRYEVESDDPCGHMEIVNNLFCHICNSPLKKYDEPIREKFTQPVITHNRPHNRLYDLPSYQSPITGKWIDGRVARRNDLAASGCVEYDSGMKTEQDKRHAQEDAQLDKKVDEIVEREIYSMPTEKREKLAVELENSDIAVTRI